MNNIGIFKNKTKLTCLVLGGIYAIFGSFSLLIILIQRLMISSFDPITDNSFMTSHNTLFKIWIIHMPLMVFIGLCYLIFGLLIKRIKSSKFQINLFLSIFSFVWVVTYLIRSIEYFNSFNMGMPNEFEYFKYISYVFAFFGFAVVTALFTVPQFFIGRMIKKEENEKINNNT
jgi:surface polysaccharide O-acyltransferase-like enzyme